MGKRLTDTDKWKKKLLKAMPLEYKLLWFYICDDCDQAGIWHVDMDVASMRIGAEVTEEKALDVFGEKVIPFDGGDKWFLPSFLGFQYGSQLSKGNNIFRSIDTLLRRYDLYKYTDIEVVDEGTTKSALRSRISQKVKERIIIADAFTCQYCSEEKTIKELVVDHFFPLEKGGDNSDENLITACVRCNSHKTDLLPEVFLARPHSFLNPTEKAQRVLREYLSLKGANKKLEEPKEKDKVTDKEKETDKENEKDKRGSGGKTELIPVMLAEFKKFNPNYPTDQAKDFPALLKIAEFIADQGGLKFEITEKFKSEMMPFWSHLCEHIPKDKFFKNYSISQVEKHIQSISLSFQNGSHTGTNSKITAHDLKQAFTGHSRKQQPC